MTITKRGILQGMISAPLRECVGAAQLRRVHLRWRGLADHISHILPGDPAGRTIGDWTLDETTKGLFEVGTPNWGGLAIAFAALDYVCAQSVDAIARHRAPLLDRLWLRLEQAGYLPLAPRDSHGTALVFARPGL